MSSSSAIININQQQNLNQHNSNNDKDSSTTDTENYSRKRKYNHQNQSSGLEDCSPANAAMRKVRVLPGTLLTTKHNPPEPNEEPPVPNTLTSLLIVGDANAGKTTLVKSFVYHESVSNKKEVEDNNKKKRATAAPRWSVGYFRKDTAFSNQHHCLRSLRVQLLDTSGIHPPAGDSSSSQSNSNMNKDHILEFHNLMHKASTILLVVNLRNSQETIFRNIKLWKTFLDAQQQQQQSTSGIKDKKPVVLMLHQSDHLLDSQHQKQHPAFWMDFGRKVSALCQTLHISSWHITSSCLEDDMVGNSIDNAFRDILGGSRGGDSKPYIQQPRQQQQRMMNASEASASSGVIIATSAEDTTSPSLSCCATKRNGTRDDDQDDDHDGMENTTISKTVDERHSTIAANHTMTPKANQGKQSAVLISPSPLA